MMIRRDGDDLRPKSISRPSTPMVGIGVGCGMYSRTTCGLNAIQAYVGQLGKLAVPPVTVRPVALTS